MIKYNGEKFENVSALCRHLGLPMTYVPDLLAKITATDKRRVGVIAKDVEVAKLDYYMTLNGKLFMSNGSKIGAKPIGCLSEFVRIGIDRIMVKLLNYRTYMTDEELEIVARYTSPSTARAGVKLAYYSKQCTGYCDCTIKKKAETVKKEEENKKSKKAAAVKKTKSTVEKKEKAPVGDKSTKKVNPRAVEKPVKTIGGNNDPVFVKNGDAWINLNVGGGDKSSASVVKKEEPVIRTGKPTIERRQRSDTDKSHKNKVDYSADEAIKNAPKSIRTNVKVDEDSFPIIYKGHQYSSVKELAIDFGLSYEGYLRLLKYRREREESNSTTSMESSIVHIIEADRLSVKTRDIYLDGKKIGNVAMAERCGYYVPFMKMAVWRVGKLFEIQFLRRMYGQRITDTSIVIQ